MFKLAGMVIDAYDDPSFINSIDAQQLFGTELPHPHEIDSLPDRAFAVKIADGSVNQRRYPIHTRAAAFFSAAYLESNADALPRDVVKTAAMRIREACGHYGLRVSEELDKLAGEVGDANLQHMDVVVEQTPEQAVAGSLEKVAGILQDQFIRNYSRMSPRDRCEFANGLVKQAGTAAITDGRVWDYTPKPVTGPWFQEAIHDREAMVRGTEFEGLYTKLASSARLDTTETVIKLAEQMEAMDRACGLRPKYGPDLRDPYLACFGGMELSKTADELRRMEAEHKLAPADGLETREQFLVDLENRFPRWDSSYVKMASQARRLCGEFDGPYREALEEYFAE